MPSSWPVNSVSSTRPISTADSFAGGRRRSLEFFETLLFAGLLGNDLRLGLGNMRRRWWYRCGLHQGVRRERLNERPAPGLFVHVVFAFVGDGRGGRVGGVAQPIGGLVEGLLLRCCDCDGCSVEAAAAVVVLLFLEFFCNCSAVMEVAMPLGEVLDVF